MDIETRTEDGALIVKVMAKRLDSASAPMFKGIMVDFITRENLRIALDLEHVEFMDSSGLSALLSTLKTLKGRGRLVLYGVGPNVAKLFSITRLDRGVFDIFPDHEKAMASLWSQE
ncbi:MAG: anti-sigma factor antagonist [Desulfonatronovibrio sp. MSAO_Bac4]|nr:MAG: anti-sigma factor antagonist [Desulfonatronovibrio sp. MSAO_Bac4]